MVVAAILLHHIEAKVVEVESASVTNKVVIDESSSKIHAA